MDIKRLQQLAGILKEEEEDDFDLSINPLAVDPHGHKARLKSIGEKVADYLQPVIIDTIPNSLPTFKALNQRRVQSAKNTSHLDPIGYSSDDDEDDILGANEEERHIFDRIKNNIIFHYCYVEREDIAPDINKAGFKYDQFRRVFTLDNKDIGDLVDVFLMLWPSFESDLQPVFKYKDFKDFYDRLNSIEARYPNVFTQAEDIRTPLEIRKASLEKLRAMKAQKGI